MSVNGKTRYKFADAAWEKPTDQRVKSLTEI